MLQHPLAVLDLASAEPAAVGAVQPGRMALETHAFQFGLGGMPGARRTQRETNDHEDHDI
jgi:hypothetical protein